MAKLKTAEAKLKTELETGFNMKDPMAAEFIREVLHDNAAELADREALEAVCSPLGALGLPKHLDERRRAYLIPDAAFTAQCLYDKLALWQILPEDVKDGVTAGGVALSDMSIRIERMENPRGVIVGAGQQAMDTLYASGQQLGDIVNFLRHVPWKMPIGRIRGRDRHVLVVHDGDLVRNEDLVARFRSGELSMVREKWGKKTQHTLKDKDSVRAPIAPWLPEDME
jgi:hypothetical protein